MVPVAFLALRFTHLDQSFSLSAVVFSLVQWGNVSARPVGQCCCWWMEQKKEVVGLGTRAPAQDFQGRGRVSGEPPISQVDASVQIPSGS